jgi:hypothetical protein
LSNATQSSYIAASADEDAEDDDDDEDNDNDIDETAGAVVVCAATGEKACVAAFKRADCG